MAVHSSGRDWSSTINWDDLGKFYASFIILWTIVLAGGAVWLLLNRHATPVRVRGLSLSLTSVLSLHIYLVKIFTAYIVNGNFSCAAEFWIMSIYLPFGIALYQANLSKLRSVSDQQMELLSPMQTVSNCASPLSTFQQFRAFWRLLPSNRKMYIYIGTAMVVQLLITIILYSTSSTLQGDWSSYGPVSHAAGQALCRRSTLWIPSIFWQLAWTWLYGPFIWFKVRNIKDIHLWRSEVILGVIAGLPGTPLWLAAVYSHAFEGVNRWWVPSMWVAPGVMTMQFTTLFFPGLIVWRDRIRHSNRAQFLEISSKTSQANLSDKADTHEPEDRSPSDEVHQRLLRSRNLFEHLLIADPTPLLHFAATREFTAENIMFLLQIRKWRDDFRWATETNSPRRPLFDRALEIYLSWISKVSSRFPVMLDNDIRRDLDMWFTRAMLAVKSSASRAAQPFSPESRTSVSSPWSQYMPMVGQTGYTPISPYRDYNWSGSRGETSPDGLLATYNLEAHSTIPHSQNLPAARKWHLIEAQLNERFFDDAERCVRDFVWKSTWHNFIEFVDC